MTGWISRERPAVAVAIPERSRTAGDRMLPPASATSGARTVISPPGTRATTPVARPPSTTIRRTSVRSRTVAPSRQAAARYVRSAERLAPRRHPTAHGPQSPQPRTFRGTTADGRPSASETGEEPPVRAVRLALGGRDVDLLLDRRVVGVEVVADPGGPPLVAHLGGGPQRRGPVDDGAAPDRAPRPDRDPAVGGGRQAAVQEEVGEAVELGAAEAILGRPSPRAPGRRPAGRPRRGRRQRRSRRRRSR